MPILEELFGPPKLVHYSNVLVETKTRLFPYSRHRSRRIHKKLVQRYGGEFAKKVVTMAVPESVMHRLQELITE